MTFRFKRLPLLAIGAVLALPGGLLGSAGFQADKGDSFLTKTVGLERFAIGKVHQYPAGQYKFRVVGTGKPGVVTIKILDGGGKLVGKVAGRFAGTCPGKPTKTTFAQLGYSESSEVNVAPQTGGGCNLCQVVTIECGKGSRIEFKFSNYNEA